MDQLGRWAERLYFFKLRALDAGWHESRFSRQEIIDCLPLVQYWCISTGREKAERQAAWLIKNFTNDTVFPNETMADAADAVLQAVSGEYQRLISAQLQAAAAQKALKARRAG